MVLEKISKRTAMDHLIEVEKNDAKMHEKIAEYMQKGLTVSEANERARRDLLPVPMVMKMHSDRGEFYGENPTCIGVPRGMEMAYIVQNGYIPYHAYFQLLAKGKSEQEIIKYADTLVRMARERLSAPNSANVYKVDSTCFVGTEKPIDNRTFKGFEREAQLAKIEADAKAAEQKQEAEMKVFCTKVLDDLVAGE